MTELAAVGGRSRGPLAGSDYLARLPVPAGSAPGRCRTGPRSAPRSTRWPRPARSSASAPGTATGPAGTWPAPPTGCWCGTGSDSPRPFRSASTPCITGCSPPWSAGASRRRPPPPTACGRRPRLLAPVRRAGRRGTAGRYPVPGRAVRSLPGRPPGRGGRTTRAARHLADSCDQGSDEEPMTGHSTAAPTRAAQGRAPSRRRPRPGGPRTPSR